MTKTKTTQSMSGRQFVELVQADLQRKNAGLGKITLSQLSYASGLSKRYLTQLAKSDEPNPSVKVIRLVLFTLGYEIEKPEEDVIPHLKEKGVFNEKLHRREFREAS